jgi:inorganic pyrophosphatase
LQHVRYASAAAAPPDIPTYFKDANGRTISPWHDIPLTTSSKSLVFHVCFEKQSSLCRIAAASNVFNFVCEIPRGTTAKFEVTTDEAHNPIKYDRTKDDKPRYGEHVCFVAALNFSSAGITSWSAS